MTAPLSDELVTLIARLACHDGDTKTVSRIARVARRFPPLIIPILYRRIVVQERNFAKLAATLLPASDSEDETIVAKKALRRATVAEMDFLALPDEEHLRIWNDGLNRCFHHFDISDISDTAMTVIAGPKHGTAISRYTLFPRLAVVTVTPRFLERLTMTILANHTSDDEPPLPHLSLFFANILKFGSLKISLSFNLDWVMTRARFIREIRGRIYENKDDFDNSRPEQEAIDLFTLRQVDMMRSNPGLELLFRHRTNVHQISFHSIWYNTHLPERLRADRIVLEFAKYAGMSLLNDNQPRPVCFKTISEIHTKLTKKINWPIFNLDYKVQQQLEEDEELMELPGFRDRLYFMSGTDPSCIWDH